MRHRLKSTVSHTVAVACGAAFVLALLVAQDPPKPAPVLVWVGLSCDGDAVRLYGRDDHDEAAQACQSVEMHAAPIAQVER